MEDKNLINLIKHQQEKIDRLEEAINTLLYKGVKVLLATIQEQKEEISKLKGE
jgi:hypothetical protein|tara:strand:+ start:422 stop:580 length:159 start_codon:yes stop_codon:yes gene_type:complete